MTKKEFTDYIYTIQRYDTYLDEKALNNEDLYASTELCDMENSIYKILKENMHDKDDLIPFFVNELDCGRFWKPNFITDSSGNELKLETVDDLWNILNNNIGE